MVSHYITHKNSSVHYRQFGNGDKLLFCFHGYGRDSNTFALLDKKLQHTYTIIAIDVPFHGLTDWKDALVFHPKYLVEIVTQIQQSFAKQGKFSVLGFSMGGRIALYLTQLIPQKVEKLILLAPDGLSFSFWRWLASETWIGSKLLAYTIEHPAWVQWIVKKAQQWNVISRSLADFIRYYIHDREHRILLYRRWISMRKFQPSARRLKRLIRKHRIPVRMLFGAFDRVIPSAGGEKFLQGLEQHATLQTIQAGHNLMYEVQADKIAKLISS